MSGSVSHPHANGTDRDRGPHLHADGTGGDRGPRPNADGTGVTEAHLGLLLSLVAPPKICYIDRRFYKTPEAFFFEHLYQQNAPKSGYTDYFTCHDFGERALSKWGAGCWMVPIKGLKQTGHYSVLEEVQTHLEGHAEGQAECRQRDRQDPGPCLSGAVVEVPPRSQTRAGSVRSTGRTGSYPRGM